MHLSSQGDVPSTVSCFQVDSFDTRKYSKYQGSPPACGESDLETQTNPALETASLIPLANLSHSSHETQPHLPSITVLGSDNEQQIEHLKYNSAASQQHDIENSMELPCVNQTTEVRLARLERLLQDKGEIPTSVFDDEDVHCRTKGIIFRKRLEQPKEKVKGIRLKDAVGRRFNFPFHLCTTWTVRILHQLCRTKSNY